jgi:KDO2-lipid IV(A) lauroyltransferase
MLGALRSGATVGFVMDQKPDGRQGPIVPFFGQPTAFVAGPAAMALRCGCPVVAIFCLREGPFRYRLVSETVEVPAGGDAELALTARMAATVERVIRDYPEQWTWNYRRWRFT